MGNSSKNGSLTEMLQSSIIATGVPTSYEEIPSSDSYGANTYLLIDTDRGV